MSSHPMDTCEGIEKTILSFIEKINNYLISPNGKLHHHLDCFRSSQLIEYPHTFHNIIGPWIKLKELAKDNLGYHPLRL